ncbi:concanavalin A-like lectin/glucanase domain, Xyloglucan endotransglucosylase/hydrolase [Artemisia annua]|uniref:xyloglucan:xyloglucosyl transferase n=1 Tax=Artemisia annua TaxID=35608 RepID=A0A2U1Q4Y2_ARTAN|nr:concanavalin A-like lectin/glucanase domain, Xyloglucan endotransglucosylase/hydrolase [Artemisia annua]
MFCSSLSDTSGNASFDQNYYITWGQNRVLFFENKREVQLSLDQYSGAGFASKAYFGSGFFQMRIKLPARDSSGVVTAFYLNLNGGVHDELDFEFLGNRPGRSIILQTNVFANGLGGREQRTLLWFDPTTDFHYYKFLWNQHQIVFFIDDIPIRVYKNDVVTGQMGYPHRAMQVVVSLWDGSNWATDGGKSKANWSNAPFQAHFQDFNIDGCPSNPNSPNKDCYSTKYWWNKKKHWHLNHRQTRDYENVRRKYMNYDYCTDRNSFVAASIKLKDMDVPEVNKKLLDELEEMGFSLARAMRALHFSGNSSLEDAISWLIDHENDPDIDEMPSVPVKIEIEGLESSSISEEVKLKAQKLREKSRKRNKEEDKKLEHRKEKVERRARLGSAPQSNASLETITPMVHENKETTSVTSKRVGVESTTKADLMRDCLRSLRRNNKDDEFKVKRAFETLLIYVRNVARDPDENKYRKIRLSNPAFKERVGIFTQGIKFLELCGFERVEGGKYLFLPRDRFELAVFKSAMNQLHSAITNPYFGLLSTEA